MSDDCGLELRMPFVVCTSQGGPYEDDAFVAGYRFAELMTRLTIGQPSILVSFEPVDLVPQLDLLAMDLGYTMETELLPDDEFWAMVTFEVAVDEDDE